MHLSFAHTDGKDGTLLLLHRQLCLLGDHRCSTRKCRRLRHLRSRLNLNGQTSMGYGNRQNPYIRSHHYGTGPLRDDYLGRFILSSLNLLNLGDKIHHTSPVTGRNHHSNRSWIRSLGSTGEYLVYGFGYTRGGDEIGNVQIEIYHISTHKRTGNRPFNYSAVGNPSSSGVVFLNPLSATPSIETTDGYGSLRHSVNLAVRAKKGCHYKCSTLQGIGISYGGNVNVYLHSRLCKGGKLCRDYNRRHVAHIHLVSGNVDSKALKHVGYALVVHLGIVACIIKPHHKAVAHQEVLSNTLHTGEILYPRRLSYYRQKHSQKQNRKPSHGHTSYIRGQSHRRSLVKRPGDWLLLTTPLPSYTISASAKASEETVLLGPIS